MRLRFWIALTISLVFCSATVLALSPSNVTSLTVESSARRSISDSAKSDNALAGNVTELTLNLTKVTEGWQGYYGNVQGEIVLDDASSNSMYTWNVEPVGEVYATRNSSLNWSAGNLVCASDANVAKENTDIFGSTNAGDADNVSNTFNLTTHPAITTNGNTLTADSCGYSVSTYVTDAADSGRTFNQTLLWSTSDTGIVYTAILNKDQTGFTGSSYDFQMLVGENGHGDSATTTYYFFLELT